MAPEHLGEHDQIPFRPGRADRTPSTRRGRRGCAPASSTGRRRTAASRRDRWRPADRGRSPAGCRGPRWPDRWSAPPPRRSSPRDARGRGAAAPGRSPPARRRPSGSAASGPWPTSSASSSARRRRRAGRSVILPEGTGARDCHTLGLPSDGHGDQRCVRTAYGPASALALRDAVAEAKGGEPLAPVTVVVPSNHVGVATRRLLSSGSLGPVAGAGVGLAAVSFLTTYRLAELLGAATLAGQGRRPVSTPVLAAAVRAELAEDPGLFAPVAEHPATESALVATYRELRDLSPGALDALAGRERPGRRGGAPPPGDPRLGSSRAGTTRKTCSPRPPASPARPAVAALGALVVHLPQRLSQHSARLLVALAEHVPTTVVAGFTGVAEADAEVADSLRRLGLDPDGGRRRSAIPRRSRPTARWCSPRPTATRRSARPCGPSSTPCAPAPGSIASPCSTRQPEPYARLAHEQLHAAGIPTNGAAVVPLAARVAGRTLLELLALPGRRLPPTGRVRVAVVGAGPPRRTGWPPPARGSGCRARRRWSPVATTGTTRLTQLAQRNEEHAAEAELDDDEPEWVPGRLREEAERARELQAFVLELIDDLSAAAARPRRWSEHAAWAQRWLGRLLGGAAPPRAVGRPGRAQGGRAGRRGAAPPRRARRGGGSGVARRVPPHPRDRARARPRPGRPLRRRRAGRLGGDGHRARPRPGRGARAWPRARSPPPSATTRSSPTTSAPAPAASWRSAPSASSGSTASSSPPSPARAATCSCVPRGDLRRSVERVPSALGARPLHPPGRSAVAAGGRPTSSPPASRGCGTWRPSTPGLRHLDVPATAQEHRLRALLAAGGDLAGHRRRRHRRRAPR